MSDNFIKKTWVNGDVITAEELNRMEDGIDNSTTKYNELKTQSDENSDLIKEYLVSDNIIYSQPELVIGEAGDTNQKATFFTVDGPFTAGDVYTFVCDSIENAVASTILQANSMSSNDIIMKIDATTDPNDNDLSVTVTQQQIDNGLDRIVFSVNASDSTPLEDSCVITNPMIVKGDEFALQYTDEFEAIVSDIVEDTVRPPIEGMGNMLMELGSDVEELQNDLGNITIAESSDVGKTLKVATVEDGKVTEWEFDDKVYAPVITEEAAGNVISFSNGIEGYPITDLIVDISPKQYDYPTPTDPVPFISFETMNITVCGDNIANISPLTEYMPSNVSIDYMEDGVDITATGSDASVVYEFNGLTVGNHYTFSYYADSTIGDESFSQITDYFSFYQHFFMNNTYDKVSYEFDAVETQVHFIIYVTAGNTSGTVRIRNAYLGTTPENAFIGNTYSIDLTNNGEIDTVCAGSLDVINGQLCVTHDIKTVDPVNDEISKRGELLNGNIFAITIPDAATDIEPNDYKKLKSNVFANVGKNYQNGMDLYTFTQDSNRIIFLLPTDVSTVEQAREWFSNLQIPVQFIYKLATPRYYRLYEEKVLTTIQGLNNVFANTGDITYILYPVETWTYVDGEVVHVYGTNPTIKVKHNCRYICENLIESLTIEYGDLVPENNILDIHFRTAGDPSGITINKKIGWIGDFDPQSIHGGSTYELNIMDDLGVVAEWVDSIR